VVVTNKQTNIIDLQLKMSDCCLTPSEQFLSYIMARTSCISKRWWCLLCTRPTCL